MSFCERARVFEAPGLICYHQIDTRGIGGAFVALSLSNKLLKLCIWEKLFIASSVGSESKLPIRRKLSYIDECESISLLIYSKHRLNMVLWGL